MDDLRPHLTEIAAAVSRYAEACALAAASANKRGQFEHVREGRTALLLLRGHAQALNVLVPAGAQLYPSGWPVARAMLEVGIRSAWRMNRENPLEAEVRWVTWLRRRAQYEERYGRPLAEAGGSQLARASVERVGVYSKFCDDLTKQLRQRGIHVPTGTKEPHMPDVMKELGLGDQYRVYAEASERQHGNHLGLEAWTRNLGTTREYGEFASWLDWIPVLAAGRGGIHVLAQVFAVRTETPEFDDVIAEADADWAASTAWLLIRADDAGS